jgi:hypothetical protein
MQHYYTGTITVLLSTWLLNCLLHSLYKFVFYLVLKKDKINSETRILQQKHFFSDSFHLKPSTIDEQRSFVPNIFHQRADRTTNTEGRRNLGVTKKTVCPLWIQRELGWVSPGPRVRPQLQEIGSWPRVVPRLHTPCGCHCFRNNILTHHLCRTT